MSGATAADRGAPPAARVQGPGLSVPALDRLDQVTAALAGTAAEYDRSAAFPHALWGPGSGRADGVAGQQLPDRRRRRPGEVRRGAGAGAQMQPLRRHRR